MSPTPIFEAVVTDLQSEGVDLSPVLTPRPKWSIEETQRRIDAGESFVVKRATPAKKTSAAKKKPTR